MMNRVRLGVVLLVAFVMVVACNGRIQDEAVGATAQPLDGSGISANITFDSDWTSGYVATVTVRNTGSTAVAGWVVVLDLHQSALDGRPWNANYSANATLVTFTPLGYNAGIAPGAAVTFGLKGRSTGKNYHPTVVSVTRTGDGTTGSGGSSAAGGSTNAGGTHPAGGSAGSSGALAELSIEIPQGVSLHRVALGATRSVVVGDGVVVSQGAGGEQLSISSLGGEETNLGANADINADIWSVGPVMQRADGRVIGNVTTESIFDHQGVPHVSGTVRTNTIITPSRRYAWNVAIPPETESFDLGQNETRNLASGSYGVVAVNQNATLSLSKGIYFFRQLTFQSGSTLDLNATDAPLFIYVRDNLTHRGRVTGVGADRMLVGYFGTNVVDIDGPFAGTVVAPNANLRLSPVDGTGHAGSFFAKAILNDARNPLTFVPFKHWDSVFPPRLILEGISRAAWKYGAGLFGYENPLDFEVRIPAGSRNFLSPAAASSQALLEVFQPGVHRKEFILPFRGDSISWTLGDTSVLVDDNARPLALSDYRIQRKDRIPYLLGGDGDTTEPLLPEGIVPDLLDPDGAPASEVTAGPPLRGASILVTGLGLGPSCGFPYRVDVAMNAFVHGTELRTAYPNASWSAPGSTYDPYLILAKTTGVGIWSVNSGLFTDEMNHPFNIAGIATLDRISAHFTLRQQREDSCGAYPSVVTFNIQIADSTGEVLSISALDSHGDPVPVDSHLPTLLPPGGDLSRLEYCAFASESSWGGMCIQVLPPGPRLRLCADWPVQYIDSGRGEDILNSGSIQMAPASFAHVRLDIVGGQEPYLPWIPGGYARLDHDGCLPEDLGPTRKQIETSSGLPAMIKLRWFGKMSLTVGSPGENFEVQFDRTVERDPWLACQCAGEPFRVPSSPDVPRCQRLTCDIYARSGQQNSYAPASVPIILDSIPDPGLGLTGNVIRLQMGTVNGVPTYISNVGGVVSALIRAHHRGTDMGLQPGKIQVWPNSVFAFAQKSPFNHPMPGPNGEQYLHLRPRWLPSDAAVTAPRNSDSTRKFVVTHELGHAVQSIAAGFAGGGSYSFLTKDQNGIDVELKDPPQFPPECRCTHVGGDYGDAHCMNSLEVVGGASGEGFAHYFANRIWNRTSRPWPLPPDTDCWMPYAKRVISPPLTDGSCPIGSGIGTPNICHRLGSLADNDPLLAKYTTDDRNHLRQDLANWYLIDGPATIPCADAWKWRNNFCAAANVGSLEGPTDMRLLGVEADWMQFYWNLTKGTDSWTIGQFFSLQKAACGDVNSPCPDRGDAVTRHADRAWEVYEEFITEEKPRPTGLATPLQWDILESLGDDYGVSTDLSRSP